MGALGKFVDGIRGAVVIVAHTWSIAVCWHLGIGNERFWHLADTARSSA